MTYAGDTGFMARYLKSRGVRASAMNSDLSQVRLPSYMKITDSKSQLFLMHFNCLIFKLVGYFPFFFDNECFLTISPINICTHSEREGECSERLQTRSGSSIVCKYNTRTHGDNSDLWRQKKLFLLIFRTRI